jgi:putative endonuclease
VLHCGREPLREGPMYFVYIMTNRSRSLYIGVTNNLMRRVREHKIGIGSGFTAKYKLDRLVYFERFEDVHNAIEREKRIKGRLRIKKIAHRVNESFLEGFERGVVRTSSIPTAERLRHRNNRKSKGEAFPPRLSRKPNYAAGIIFFIRSFIS